MIRSAAFLLLALATGTAQAGAREQFDAFTRKLQGLSGRFEQQVFDARGVEKESSRGNVQLRSPRQFRWEYEAPFPQLILADGDHVWVYDPDLEQATVRIQSHEEAESPLAALIDPAELDRQFKVREGGRSEGLEWLELRPRKPESGAFDLARLGFSSTGLARMEMTDSLGQRTLVRFGDWNRNPVFGPRHFVFERRDDIDIVGTMAEGAEVIPLGD